MSWDLAEKIISTALEYNWNLDTVMEIIDDAASDHMMDTFEVETLTNQVFQGLAMSVGFGFDNDPFKKVVEEPPHGVDWLAEWGYRERG